MKLPDLFKPFRNKRTLIISIMFLITGIILTTVALLIGISDHLPGIILLLLGILMLVLAIVHHWRKAKSYQVLLVVSAIAFPVSAILHNLFEAAGEYFSDITMLSRIFKALGVTFFFLAVIICPVAILIGLTGLIVFTTIEQNRRQRK
jgi:tellurite resistance protein TehA-like permease